MSLSPWRFRCPGTANADGRQHTTWTRFAENPPERRYFYGSCESYYAELIDVKTGDRRRWSALPPWFNAGGPCKSGAGFQSRTTPLIQSLTSSEVILIPQFY